ncbi:MAG TPA: TAXI family TRAP transporter solute-binding subunit [Verrucomicrobiae bacterium]
MSSNQPVGILTSFRETFGLGRGAALSAILLIAIVAVFAGFSFFKSAPPGTITITSGPDGSLFRTNAEKYRIILARNKVKLEILPSHGSLENMQRLDDPSFKVDVGFVQGGVTNGIHLDRLVSLGSIAYQPLLVFYRATNTIEMLSDFVGKRLAIGPPGSGSRTLAVALLTANGIESGGPTTFLDLDSEAASNALLAGSADAVFLMGDSASTVIMRKLLRSSEIHLMSFSQADGYSRRYRYLNKLQLPQGSIDFGKNLPAHDIALIGPTVELVARTSLHPALSDLLLEAAREIHGSASLLQRRGEFPAPLEHDLRISEDATRYYKTGKSFLYRHLPFWLASLVNRILVVILPAVVVLIPGLKVIPGVFRWRVKLRLYRWYRALLLVERELFAPSPVEPSKLLNRLTEIENAVNKMKVPASFADQFYSLRGHINFVRIRISEMSAARPA